MKAFLAIVACIATLIGLAVWWDSSIPNSTPGVSVVGGNTARLPGSETFILTHLFGKTTQVWEITYDSKDAVKFHCQTWFCSDLDTAHLCGVDCNVDVDAGWGDHFTLSLRKDEAVNVKWPWGWTYRPYKS